MLNDFAKACLVLLLVGVTIQSTSVMAQDALFDRLWSQVDSLNAEGLARSARDKTADILALARERSDDGQVLKALLYEARYTAQLEEGEINRVVADFRREIERLRPIPAAILQSVLGEVYWQYYQSRRWVLLDRGTVSEDTDDDVETWSARTLIVRAIDLLKESISNRDLLAAEPLDDYQLLLQGPHDDRFLRPTVYDFLAHRAIDILRNSETGLPDPAATFDFSLPAYLESASDFASVQIASPDSTSPEFVALRTFQALIQLHLGDPLPDALVTIDLERLAYVRENSSIPDRRLIYQERLEDLERTYRSQPIGTDVSFALATVLAELGREYIPFGNEENRWKLKEAHQVCEAAVARFPDSVGATNCRALNASIEAKEVTLQVEKTVEPGRPYRVRVDYRNVDRLYVASVSMTAEEFRNLPQYRSDERRALEDDLAKRPRLTSNSFQLIADTDYQLHSTELPLPSVPAGLYALVAASDVSFSEENGARTFLPIAASRLATIDRNLLDGTLEVRVVDNVTGLPIEGAVVSTYALDYTSGARFSGYLGETESDAEGIAIPVTRPNRPFSLTIQNGEDRLVGVTHRYAYSRTDDEERVEKTSHFFTDRAIYRPGQTVYFKGILLSKQGDRHAVRADESTVVEFLDPNGRAVGSLTLVSNTYGTIKGQFVAPTGAGTGEMTIRDPFGAVSVRVEEYKRPRFEVAFDSLAGRIEVRDSVLVTGRAKAFSGAPVDGATIRYRVVRRSMITPWGYRVFPYPLAEAEIASGTTTAGRDGGFSVPFVAEPDAKIDPETNPRFLYEITADATDVAGETHSGTTTVTVGYASVVLDIQSDANIMVEDPDEIRLLARNLNGSPLPFRGHVMVSRLRAPDRLVRSRPWDRVDRPIMSRQEFVDLFPLDVYDDEDDVSTWPKTQVLADSVFGIGGVAGLSSDLIRTWSPGKYKVEFLTTDSQGREVRAERVITVYSVDASAPPYPALDWFVPVKTAGEPGEQAQLLFGTSAPGTEYFVEVERKNRIDETSRIRLGNAQRLTQFAIEAADRGNFAIHVTFVRLGRLFRHTEIVSVPYTDKELTVTLETFRDMLYPGADEEWRVRVTGSRGEPVVAELMASLYDASLDQFVPHAWHFDPLEFRTALLGWRPGEWWGSESESFRGAWNPGRSYRPRRYENLNWFGLQGFLYRSRYDVMFKNAARAPDAMALDASLVMAEEVFGVADDGSTLQGRGGDQVNPAGEASPPAGSPRTNFVETAFFFPDLLTDEEGATILLFKIPEALTRWKLLGLAHTPDVRFGQVTAVTETRKDLMITANAPRFLRHGDSLQFAATVQNLSESSLTGSATLSILDPETMKPVDTAFANMTPTADFTVDAGQSAGIRWAVSVPDGIEMVIYRVLADAGSHTDGEQKPLPVLSNRMLVTESMPLPMRGPGIRQFTFQKLKENRSPTLRNHSFSLEFTPNPVWYAVQALPYMMEFPFECSEQIFSRLYANSIAAHIVEQNPRVKNVFDRWSQISAGALQSNLEKNAELKALVIEETPWLRAAQDGSERKRRIAVLFDFARMAGERETAVRQLVQSQYSTGAWPWFVGMPPSRYVTQHIVAGFGHLRRLGIYDSGTTPALSAALTMAVSYIDRQIKEDYNRLVASGVDLGDRHLGWLQIHYLYARSYFADMNVAQESRAAYEYFVGQAKRFWLDNDFYARGMIALALHRLGETETPDKIIRSLRELALQSEELGMYWKYDGGFYWYQAPIETQALLIEAFDEIADDTQSVSDMQLWLLKQKQTQDWKTTKATAEAVYALLMRGVRLLDQSGSATVRVGDRILSAGDPATSEPGTGYIYASWESEDVSPELASIEVSKSGPGPAWGAAYWQYFEDLDRITTADNPLRVEKKIFVETAADIGPVLTPIGQRRPAVGDRVVVQVTIRVDRDMEYVHLKDMRGAGLEPLNVLSEYKYRNGLGYYESTRDAATHFFIGYLPKGTYVFEYPLRANLSGDFSNGITSIQSMYAPEFAAHSAGIRIGVTD